MPESTVSIALIVALGFVVLVAGIALVMAIWILEHLPRSKPKPEHDLMDVLYPHSRSP
jgi:hypothetical protein